MRFYFISNKQSLEGNSITLQVSDYQNPFLVIDKLNSLYTTDGATWQQIPIA